MRFRCEIAMDNAAFAEDSAAELTKILTHVIQQVNEGQTGMGLMDSAGNRVGQWVLEDNDYV